MLHNATLNLFVLLACAGRERPATGPVALVVRCFVAAALECSQAPGAYVRPGRTYYNGAASAKVRLLAELNLACV